MMKKIDALTGLRFPFMMMIVISHLEFFGGGAELNLYDYMFDNAGMAVNFFFAISGFGLTYRYYSTGKTSVESLSPKSCVYYGINRVRKIYLLYIITCILVIPMQMGESILAGGDVVITAIKQWGKLAVASTLLQSLTGVVSYTHLLNRAAWFLSCVFILYMIYPVLERINIKLLCKKPYFWLIIVFLLGVIVRVILGEVENVTLFDDLAYASPYSRVFDFLLGIVLCDIYTSNIAKENIKTKHEVLTLIAVILWWLLRNSICNGSLEVMKGVVDRVIVLIVIFIFSVSKGKVSVFFASKIMVMLGSSTMYIYLIHYCVRVDAYWVLQAFISNKVILNMLTLFLIVLITAVSTASITHYKKIRTGK